MMKTHNVFIPVGEDEKVSGVVALPVDYRPGEGAGIILAHGAANDLNNPLLVFFAEGLASANKQLC